MSRHWPEIPYLLSLGSATLAALIGTYGDPASVASDPSGAEALMRRTGRPGLSEGKIQAVLDSARSSLGLGRALPIELTYGFGLLFSRRDPVA